MRDMESVPSQRTGSTCLGKPSDISLAKPGLWHRVTYLCEIVMVGTEADRTTLVREIRSCDFVDVFSLDSIGQGTGSEAIWDAGEGG